MKATENKETGEKMHIYEVSFLIVPTVLEDKLADEVGAIKSEMEASGASFIAEGAPELLTLAYTMERTVDAKKQKFDTAYFGWVKFELPVASLSNIKAMLEKRRTILRHLIIKTVRENTLYSTTLAEAALEESEKAEKAEGEAVVAGKEIDKSIDALVIS